MFIRVRSKQVGGLGLGNPERGKVDDAKDDPAPHPAAVLVGDGDGDVVASRRARDDLPVALGDDVAPTCGSAISSSSGSNCLCSSTKRSIRMLSGRSLVGPTISSEMRSGPPACGQVGVRRVAEALVLGPRPGGLRVDGDHRRHAGVGREDDRLLDVGRELDLVLDEGAGEARAVLGREDVLGPVDDDEVTPRRVTGVAVEPASSTVSASRRGCGSHGTPDADRRRISPSLIRSSVPGMGVPTEENAMSSSRCTTRCRSPSDRRSA